MTGGGVSCVMAILAKPDKVSKRNTLSCDFGELYGGGGDGFVGFPSAP